MSLNAYVAARKRALYDELLTGQEPSFGEYDPALLREARAKGAPQMGSTSLSPDRITVEFIFCDQQGATVLPIKLEPPERIIFLPIPEWVIESIWQGEIDGSYHFESDAVVLVEHLLSSLEPEANAALFAVRKVIGKA